MLKLDTVYKEEEELGLNSWCELAPGCFCIVVVIFFYFFLGEMLIFLCEKAF